MIFDKRGSLSYNDGLHSCCFREIEGNTIIKENKRISKCFIDSNLYFVVVVLIDNQFHFFQLIELIYYLLLDKLFV